MENNTSFSDVDQTQGLIQREIGVFGGNIIMSIMIIITIPIIFGNCLVLHVYRITPKLKIPINMILANLAVTDLAVGMIVIPYNLIKLYGPYGLADHQFTCMLTFYFLKVLLSESGLLVLLISMVRFISVISPYNSLIWITKFRIRVMNVLSWIYMLGIYALVVFKFSTWKPGVPCSIKIVSGKVDYMLTSAHILVFCLLTAAFNLAFLYCIKSRQKLVITTDDGKLEKQKSKMVTAVITCFYVCWIPHLVYHGFCIIRPEQANSVIANSMKWIATVVLQSNSLLNPIIYAGYNRTFRQGYVKALCCKSQNKNTDLSSKELAYSKSEHKTQNADNNSELTSRCFDSENDAFSSRCVENENHEFSSRCVENEEFSSRCVENENPEFSSRCNENEVFSSRCVDLDLINDLGDTDEQFRMTVM